jgi:hypothetical protein
MAEDIARNLPPEFEFEVDMFASPIGLCVHPRIHVACLPACAYVMY